MFDSSSSSSDESDSDDLKEILQLIGPKRRNTRKRTRNDFSHLNDDDFERKFRLPKDMVNHLLEKIQSLLEPPSFLNNPISPKLQLLITLRFYATGTFQTVLEDLFGVSQKSICNCIRRVSSAIASLAKDEIKFPTTREDITAMNREFYKIAKMPMVLGAIDGKMKKIICGLL